jgi:hypothetical protein
VILLVGGFVVPPPRGSVMIGAGLVLGSLAGLELAVREHFAGYRSHTLVLAAAVGMAVLAALFVLASDSVSPLLPVVAGLAAFGVAAWAFAGAFRRRSGGVLFRIRG